MLGIFTVHIVATLDLCAINTPVFLHLHSTAVLTHSVIRGLFLALWEYNNPARPPKREGLTYFNLGCSFTQPACGGWDLTMFLLDKLNMSAR